MKVFVAGATGALGRRLVPVLVERGHEVVGTTRTPGKADGLRTAGARPVGLELLGQPAVLVRGSHARDSTRQGDDEGNPAE